MDKLCTKKSVSLSPSASLWLWAHWLNLWPRKVNTADRPRKLALAADKLQARPCRDLNWVQAQ